MAFAYCPDCSARIYLGRQPWKGQPVTCERCDADLEVVQLNPPALDWADYLADEGLDSDWQYEVQMP